jgi:glycosyltransferase involved in cell wall biosynthesis
MISIVTATYNRAYTLPKLYKSIIKNFKYDKDLEWIIIDDGSKDNTEKLVKSWIKENKIRIKYFKQENAGKMAAINNYISKVINELVIEVDSDDYLTNDAFKKIINNYGKIKNNEKCYGLLFRRYFIGRKNQIRLPEKNKIIRMFDLYNKKEFSFDTALVFKTKIRKKYKYELENNERFVTEARMYNKVDLDSDGFYLNKQYILLSIMYIMLTCTFKIEYLN